MDTKRRSMLKRELLTLELQEQKLRKAAQKTRPNRWKAALEEKIPPRVYAGLESAFKTGFSLVFQQGRRIIELTYKKEALQQHHEALHLGVLTQASRRDFRTMQKAAKASGRKNAMATTAEGIALGALGVGMPDIVLFLSTLLKGIYETALHYGFDYESKQEQYLILKMMSAALQSGPAWLREDARVDKLLEEDAFAVTEEVFQQQLEKTASVFAMDMLVLKFLQGMPVVGILGGAANPVYYNKVMDYVQRKYRKRYLLNQLK